MIVQLVVKGLFLYFVFLVIRSLLKGVSQVKTMKDFMENQNASSQNVGRQTTRSQQKSEDVVEAEFRRL